MINTLVVLNYNDFETTKQLVDSVNGYRSIQHVVIVDNCSSDESHKKLYECYKNREDVNLLISQKNGGYAYGNNLGCRYAIDNLGTDFITIANPDVSFSDFALLQMIKFANEHEDAGCVSAIMKCNEKNRSPMAWKEPKYIDCLIESSVLLGNIFRRRVVYKMEDLKKCEASRVDVVAGSFFVLSRDAYTAINGFDESTFLYYEENILAKRLKTINKNNYLLTNVFYYHECSKSIDKSCHNDKERLKHAQNSRKVYLRQYLKCGHLKLVIINLVSVVGINIYTLLNCKKR